MRVFSAKSQRRFFGLPRDFADEEQVLCLQLFLPGRFCFSSIWSKRLSNVKPEDRVIKPNPRSLPIQIVCQPFLLFQKKKAESAKVARNDR